MSGLVSSAGSFVRGHASRAADYVSRNKWPIGMTAGAIGTLGTAGYLLGRANRKNEEAAMANAGMLPYYNMQKQGGLMMSKVAFSPVSSLVRTGLRTAGRALNTTGRAVAGGMQRLAPAASRFGNYAQGVLQRNGWQALGNGVNRAANMVANTASKYAPQVLQGTRRGAAYLRTQAPRITWGF